MTALTIKRESGFTLMEVLIAVFVLGIGLLGVAGLQSISLGLNSQSAMRTKATMLADDIADRMRANVNGIRVDAYDMGSGASATENTDCETAGTGCSATELAGHDLFEWQQESLAEALPQGQGVVCIDATPADGDPGSPACDGAGNVHAVKIWWYDKEDDERKRFVTATRPHTDS